MSKLILCDTNVWLDYYLGMRPGHESARDLIRRGVDNDVQFLVPVNALGDFFYLCQADFKRALRDSFGMVNESQGAAARESAWACLANLLEIATVVGADQGDAYIALKHKAIHGDYEDDLVLAAALRARVDCLVTSDETLRRNSPVLTLGIDEARAYLEL